MSTLPAYLGALTPAGKPPGVAYNRPAIAFAGPSNVGKSSLINSLLGKNLARTSKAPGRTQAIYYFQAADGTIFADLPGYGFARVPDKVRRSWKKMVEGYLTGQHRPALVLVLHDIRRELSTHDRELLEYLGHNQFAWLVVATKCDKCNQGQVTRASRSLIEELGCERDQVVPFSVKKGAARKKLWQKLRAAIG